MVTIEFLKTIYQNCDSGFLTITTLPNAKTVWFKVSELEKAARYAENKGKHANTFFGVGLRKNILKNNLRGGENDIYCVTALYADIDIQSDAHAQKQLPKNIDEALNFLHSLTLKPSIIVNSGNGIHAYWLLNTPFIIKNNGDKDHIVSIFKNFGKYVNSEAKKHSWKLDNVYDLARILRVPGTINHKLKNDVECRVIESDCRRYSLKDFEQLTFNEKIHGITHTNSSGIENMFQKCEFVKYCKENAANLPEPMWHAMITNLAPLKNSADVIHDFSRAYPKYSKSETDEKIRRAISEDKPHTCEYIKDHLNFDCGHCCNVKAPIVFGLPGYEEQMKELLSNKIDASKIFSRENMNLCAWAKINLPAEYAQLKLNLKGKVNLKDFEKAVRHASKIKSANKDFSENVPLKLEGLEIIHGAIIPKGWNISLNHGIQRIFDDEPQSFKNILKKTRPAH